MTRDVPLTVVSLLSIGLTSLHFAEDVVRGIEPGGTNMVMASFILVVWLYGTLALGDQRSGYAIMLLGGLLGVLVPVSHMVGAGLVGGRIAGSDGRLLWVWTLIALGTCANYAVILSVLGLWHSRRPPAA